MKQEQLIITPKDESRAEYAVTGAGDYFYGITLKRLIGRGRFAVNDETYKVKASLLRRRRIELKLKNKLIAKAWRRNIISGDFEVAFASSTLHLTSEKGELRPMSIKLGQEEVGRISLGEPGGNKVTAELSELLDIRVRLFLVSIYLLTVA
jgi:hypothetical protein